MEKIVGDPVEEGLLRKHDADLNGVWTKTLDGCPHIHKYPEGVNRCDANKMTPCVYETGDGPCELFQEILEEWRKEEGGI